jgi:hypothetical protein
MASCDDMSYLPGDKLSSLAATQHHTYPKSRGQPMKVEVLALCDHALDYGGKLIIIGIFDTIAARQLPAVHPHCAIAARLRFEKIEEGEKHVRIVFSDADGKPILGQGIEMTFNVEMPDEMYSATIQVMGNINNLKFDDYGEYAIDLAVNSRHEASIPVFVRQPAM